MNRMYALGHRSRQRGAALITATIMSVVIVAVLANIFYRHGIDVNRAVKGLHGEQALLLALSGESWALSILKEDDNNYDGLDEPWAIGLPILPVEGGSLSGQILDLQGRFNLNGFGSLNTAAKYNAAVAGANQIPLQNSPYAVLSHLSQRLELPIYPDQLGALVDWIDADHYPVPGGFEENDYLIKEPPYRTANKLLAEASELTLVEGFPAPIYGALAPYVTTLPSATTAINVNTADPVVMLALHPDLDEASIESLVLQRPWANISDFYEALSLELGLATATDAQNVMKYTPPATNTSNSGDSGDNPNDNASSGGSFELVTVQSNYFLLSVIVQLGTNRMQLDSLLYRAGAGSDVVVLERTTRFLPKTAGVPRPSDEENTDDNAESTTIDS